MSKKITKIIKIECEFCKKIFELRALKINLNKKYCSKYCSGKSEGKKRAGIKRKPRTQEVKDKISKANKGNTWEVLHGKEGADKRKKDQSKRNSGKNNPNYGKKLTDEHCNKFFRWKKGKTYEEMYGEKKAKELKETHSKMMTENHPMFGKHHSFETKAKMSENHPDTSGKNNGMYGKHHTEKSKKQISESRGDKYKDVNSPRWEGGKSFELYGIEWTEELKTEIRKRDKFVCVVCIKNGYVVHHIDYDKKNNSKDNLITLCRSCHGKTGINRNEWTKFFNLLMEKK